MTKLVGSNGYFNKEMLAILNKGEKKSASKAPAKKTTAKKATPKKK